jgi:hypothetical protein
VIYPPITQICADLGMGWANKKKSAEIGEICG